MSCSSGGKINKFGGVLFCELSGIRSGMVVISGTKPSPPRPSEAAKFDQFWFWHPGVNHGWKLPSGRNVELRVLISKASMSPFAFAQFVPTPGIEKAKLSMPYCGMYSSGDSDVRARFFGRPICFCGEYTHFRLSRTHLEQAGCSPVHFSFLAPGTVRV